MAYKIISEFPTKGRVSKFSLPKISGRFGFSLYLGTSEIFIGIAVSDVVLETVTRRRVAKISKAQTRTYTFDPLA